MKLKLFFDASKSVAARLTDTFNFVWPTAAAIWNLRWQVNGLVSILPSITEPDLRARFVTGSGIIGANLRSACLETSWEDQQQQFAKFLLFELCSLYETWCELMVAELNMPDRLSKDLQFPTSSTSKGKNGIGYVLSHIDEHKSPTIDAAFGQPLKTNRKYSPHHIEQLLICYRYFKEMRNLLIHGDKNLTAPFIQAEKDFSALDAPSLGVSEMPKYNPSLPSSLPQLSLRGVVGFGEIILKLVCTLDIELSSTSFAQTNLAERWRSRYGETPKMVAGRDKARRARRIKILVAELGLPKPEVTVEFESWLEQERLVFY